MWNVMPQAGLTTTVIDFTSEFSPFLLGLLGLLGLSAGMIAWIAIRYYWSQKADITGEAVSFAESQREAA
jgi:hypothetical protein